MSTRPCESRLDAISAVLYLMLFYVIAIGLCAHADLCLLF